MLPARDVKCAVVMFVKLLSARATDSALTAHHCGPLTPAKSNSNFLETEELIIISDIISHFKASNFSMIQDAVFSNDLNGIYKIVNFEIFYRISNEINSHLK